MHSVMHGDGFKCTAEVHSNDLLTFTLYIIYKSLSNNHRIDLTQSQFYYSQSILLRNVIINSSLISKNQ